MQQNIIRNLLKVSNALLLNSDNAIGETSQSTLYQILDEKIQESYKDYYEKSEVKAKINEIKNKEKTDIEALKIISELANNGEGGWTATFPNLRIKEQGMDCTLATAMLHASLEELGYTQIHSTLRLGHYIVTRITGSGEIYIYDPATTITKNGITSGYSRELRMDQVKISNIDEGFGRIGKLIEVVVEGQDFPGGFREADVDGKYRQVLYASPEETYLDSSVALENIDSLKKDARNLESLQRESGTEPNVWQQQASQVIKNHPEVLDFDYYSLKKELGFFDPHDIIK